MKKTEIFQELPNVTETQSEPMLLEKWCWQTCWTHRPATSLQFVNNCKQSVRRNKKRSAGIEETDLIKGPSSLGKSVENRNKFPTCIHCYQECFTIQKCWLFNSISFPAHIMNSHHEFLCGTWMALYSEATPIMVMTQMGLWLCHGNALR